MTAAPAYGQLFGGDDVARKQIAEQSKRLDDLRKQNDALAARLARIEDLLKSPGSSNPTLELAQQLELMRQELKQLRGQIEVLGNDMQMTAKRQRDMYVDLDSRLKRFEQPAAGTTAPSPAPAAAATSAPPSGPAAAGKPPAVPGAAAPAVASAAPPGQGAAGLPPAEAGAYEAAQGQRRIGNYQGAIAGFQNFIAQYPKSQLAPRAQYWIGDSYYNLRDFRSAIASQQKLINTWPDNASVPDALLNIASCQLEMGDAVGAKRTMDGLVARYPASEAAEKARRRLATLK
jgi:tol-pal system protein YbgF